LFPSIPIHSYPFSFIRIPSCPFLPSVLGG
jgi:hypothetical protein